MQQLWEASALQSASSAWDSSIQHAWLRKLGGQSRAHAGHARMLQMCRLTTGLGKIVDLLLLGVLVLQIAQMEVMQKPSAKWLAILLCGVLCKVHAMRLRNGTFKVYCLGWLPAPEEP